MKLETAIQYMQMLQQLCKLEPWRPVAQR